MEKSAIGRDVVKTGGEVKPALKTTGEKSSQVPNKYYNFLLDWLFLKA
jgi:hypothetical protein